MKPSIWSIALVILGIFTIPALANETRYISEDIATSARSGPTDGYRIVFYAKAGEQVNLLETDAEAGYSKIRDSRNREGWVLTKEITETPSVKVRLANTLIELDKLKKDKEAEITRLKDQLEKLRNLASRSAEFQKQISELQTHNNTLEQQNRVSSDRFHQEFFFAGAVVLLSGSLIGVVLGRAFRKKRSNWG